MAQMPLCGGGATSSPLTGHSMIKIKLQTKEGRASKRGKLEEKVERERDREAICFFT